MAKTINAMAKAIGTGAVATGLALGIASPASAASVPIVRVDLGAGGVQANGGVWDAPALSADGRYVAFASEATNLVPGDTNGYVDVFVRDRVKGTTTRVSVSSSGAQGNGFSSAPSISADGRYVTFASYASNLTSGDKNSATGGSDVFLHDMKTGKTVIVSKSYKGTSSNGESDFPQISGNGRYVVFDSIAVNLVKGDKNTFGDVFVWDRKSGKLRLASTDAHGHAAKDGGSGLASIDYAGDKIAFSSSASNLVKGDKNQITDAFVKNLKTGHVTRISVASNGAESNGESEGAVISGDGSTAAFVTAWQLDKKDLDWNPDVYVRQLSKHKTILVSAALVPNAANDQRGESYGAALSFHGRYVAFTSDTGDLLANVLGAGSQAFLRDTKTGALRQLSTVGAAAADDTSHNVVITGDVQHIAFDSQAQSLVRWDNNHAEDIFMLDTGGKHYAAGDVQSADVYAPDTIITAAPDPSAPVTTWHFEYTANEANVTYQCRMDADAEQLEAGWGACAAVLAGSLATGDHTFEVRAIDAAGNVDPSPASAFFSVETTPTTS
jgi:Tol biopolymer transport system component